METAMVQQSIDEQRKADDVRPLEDIEINLVSGGTRTRAILGSTGQIIGYADD
jgi:hypothetical protein